LSIGSPRRIVKQRGSEDRDSIDQPAFSACGGGMRCGRRRRLRFDAFTQRCGGLGKLLGVSGVVRLVRSLQLSGVADYAYAASVDGSVGLVFTAGACPLDGQGRTVAIGDYAEQARQAMSNLRIALHDAGAELGDVVKSTVYVASADRADLQAAWEAVSDAFGEHDAPSTLLGVAVLGYEDQLVEVEAIAAVRS
jgi:enamine deaminase RidA (YjgF/YER057c/UK114 family)